MISDPARAILTGDYPERVKQRVLLTVWGALVGKRKCLVCGAMGHTTRVFIPPECLRLDRPDYRGLCCYWVCLEHDYIDGTDPALQATLLRRAR
jgi:hypothetical protein